MIKHVAPMKPKILLGFRVLIGGVALSMIPACAPPKSDVPGISLGAPDVGWSRKNPEQRFGFMAAQVQPRMHALFEAYDDGYAEDFSCQLCHGEDAERIDWKMPNENLFALPADRPLEASREYDEEMTEFMASEVTPALKQMLNTGLGEPVATSCFSCHPTE